MPDKQYDKGETALVIVSFDIPEEFRKKRDWLREVLRNLDFEMVHKSVWIGQSKIPSRMIKDLEIMDMFDYLQIFEVTKSGTLRKI